MGSLMVEPDKILDSNSPFSTIKVACISIEKLASSSGGIFFHRNPLTYQTPLMMLQLSLASVVIMLTAFLLKPLGQPLMASQMLGGIILGPSFLGQKASIRNALFPTASLVMLDLLAVFGVMFYFFLVGVQMDPWIIKKSGKKSMAIGIAVVISSLTFSAFSYILVMAFMHPDPMSSHSIPFTGAAEAMVTFPAIAFFLSELKILNSDFGRLALSSSMVSGLVGAVLFTTTFLKPSSHRTDPSSIHKFATAIVLAMVIFFVFRPAVLWKIRRCSKGETVTQGFIYSILVTVLVTGFISQYVGHHVMFGPFFLGMVIPAGPPLGSALVKRLEIIISGMLLPLYFVKNGLITDVFAVRWTQFVVVEFVILFGCVGKFLGAFLPALYCRMPLRDAISLGLIMNVQGVLELTIFRMMKRKQIIDDESFVTMCLSMVLVTGVITPLVKALYDPSRRYAVYKRRTIQHSKPNTELRVLMCIHNEERIPAMINLLETSNHTKENPINVYVLHLIELVGSAAPLLISHELWTRPSNANLSEHVVGAFRHYELDNQDTITVHSFTSVAPYASMHDDVCTLALNKRTSLIVVPFHKHWATNGPLESFHTGLRTVNSNVLDKAPCSVAILVDRGLFSDSRSALENWSPFCVAVLFLGGADDRETLAYGARMAEHLKVNLTVVRFLQDQNETSDGRETKLDDHVVNEFKLKMVGNERVTYKEEVVMDGLGTLGVIHSMEGDYQLFMVGRRHEKQSTLISGLTEWDECTELGTIGDLLASSDFRGNATVLVVQQQANVVPGLLDNLESPNLSSRVTRDVLEEEAEELPIQRREA